MIVTFGSLNADLIFSVETLPRPGQTLMAKGLATEAGGKGANQALAAALDGAEVAMAGAVGQDALAEVALAGLKGRVDLSRVARLEASTGCAAIHRDAEGRNEIVVAGGANLAASSGSVEDALLDRASVLLLQMENDPAQIERVIRRCRPAKAMSILNLAPACRLDPEVLGLCDLIVVNEDEAAAMAGWLGCAPEPRALALASGAGILRTLGGEGAELCWQGQEISIPALSCRVKDTTAAGDCFVGVFAAALDRGETPEAALRRAAAAAAIACTRIGSQSSLPEARDTDAVLAAAAV
ncbi:ribokinase [Rhodovulum sulfidophilum]|uniref:ribokinase n=1 Tax=Rhodovulum sulfidophilum TaxID=35806 RepID=UPI001913CACC|nr:ribokinase [Rhodovulum sulfidophilum]MBK5922461.1 ribokinase [Rhodovulum sulfidophilum]